MTPFEYVTAAILLILGLGITGLLGALLETLRAHQTIRLDWIPLTWAVLIFLAQMQFLWASYELNGLIRVWRVSTFALMIGLALLLFAAGALVLPRDVRVHQDNGFETFRQDGRWALVALGVYFAAGFGVNPLLFGMPVFDPLNIAALVLGLVALATFFAKTRRRWVVGTLLFLGIAIPALVLFSPPAY